jgi:hypothetical protein
MGEEKEKDCWDDGTIRLNGTKFCKEIFWDIYCFRCVDGEWEELIE